MTAKQQADSAMSVEWKKQSRKLLQNAIDTEDLKELTKAIIWCGTYGNVIRSVKKGEMEEFAEYILNNKKDILTGKYKVAKKWNPNEKSAASYVSKICHILNPQAYPVIYDSRTKKRFKWNDMKKYNDNLQEWRNDCKNKSDVDLYKKDSDLWASL